MVPWRAACSVGSNGRLGFVAGSPRAVPASAWPKTFPHACPLCSIHQHRLPNAGLQWKVTTLHWQGVKADKYQVSSGCFPVGQDWLGVRCCLCRGCMAPCLRNENALQQGCGRPSQGISVLRSPPPPCARAEGDGILLGVWHGALH